MTKKKTAIRYSAEFRERGVRLYFDNRPDYPSDKAAYKAIGAKLGVITHPLAKEGLL